MAVMAREKWTDERLDDLNARVERGFDEVKGDIRELQAETKTEFRELRAEMNNRFNGIDARFDSLQNDGARGRRHEREHHRGFDRRLLLK